MGIALQVVIIAALGGLAVFGGIQGMSWLVVGIIFVCAGANIWLWLSGRSRAARLAQYLGLQRLRLMAMWNSGPCSALKACAKR